MEKIYNIYTDGAYSSKNNIGGIGFIILDNNYKKICEFSKAYKNTTNQRMELMAILIALSSIKESSTITLYTDSMYCVGELSLGWKRKSNLDLLTKLDTLVKKHNITFKHVKGHSENIYNNHCDQLATLAINKVQ